MMGDVVVDRLFLTVNLKSGRVLTVDLASDEAAMFELPLKDVASRYLIPGFSCLREKLKDIRLTAKLRAERR